MIKLVIFDLDGVLYESKEFHFDALNYALSEVDNNLVISKEEHLKTYDGLSTKRKLDILSTEKNLNPKFYKQIWNRKQEITGNLLDKIEVNKSLINSLGLLRSKNIKVICCSNSIKKTVDSVLMNLGIYDLFDAIYSNEDVENPKPHPEMYWKALIRFSVTPDNALIVEDSPVGRLGAKMSGCNTVFINSPKDLNDEIFDKIINMNKKEIDKDLNTYVDKNLNILIPMAGLGSRFSKQGYVFPKPLIEVKGKPMIQLVVENLNIDGQYTFIVLQEHIEKYNIDKMLKLIKPDCNIVITDGITEGAASTTLLAKEFINNENPLVIANSDQYFEWNPREVIYSFMNKNIDGGILTFPSTHPKWSYAKINETGNVVEVAEKNPISNHATVGVYFWTHGSDYVTSAEEMIDKNIRVNNEFYVCPVYNQAIENDKKIVIKDIDKMWGIGTPEDLETFLRENSDL
jgi:HAD superfamily hydrolase (TIGR01509 family)